LASLPRGGAPHESRSYFGFLKTVARLILHRRLRDGISTVRLPTEVEQRSVVRDFARRLPQNFPDRHTFMPVTSAVRSREVRCYGPLNGERHIPRGPSGRLRLSATLASDATHQRLPGERIKAIRGVPVDFQSVRPFAIVFRCTRGN